MSGKKNPAYKFRYREIDPPADVSHLAFCIFEFSIEPGGYAPLTYEVVPDGFAGILFKHNPDRASEDMLLVRGLSLETFSAPVWPGETNWGVRIKPAANRLIFRCDPKSVPTMPINGPGFLTHVSDILLKPGGRPGNFGESAETFTRFLKSLEIEPSRIDPAVSGAVEMITGSRGAQKISQIAEPMGMSTRQLERRFRKEVGMTLKQYARLFRLRSTAISLIEEDNMNWANRAAEMGYADQSHLIREFVAITGRRPRGFTSDVEKMRYGKFVR